MYPGTMCHRSSIDPGILQACQSVVFAHVNQATLQACQSVVFAHVQLPAGILAVLWAPAVTAGVESTREGQLVKRVQSVWCTCVVYG